MGLWDIYQPFQGVVLVDSRKIAFQKRCPKQCFKQASCETNRTDWTASWNYSPIHTVTFHSALVFQLERRVSGASPVRSTLTRVPPSKFSSSSTNSALEVRIPLPIVVAVAASSEPERAKHGHVRHVHGSEWWTWWYIPNTSQPYQAQSWFRRSLVQKQSFEVACSGEALAVQNAERVDLPTKPCSPCCNLWQLFTPAKSRHHLLLAQSFPARSRHRIASSAGLHCGLSPGYIYTSHVHPCFQ